MGRRGLSWLPWDLTAGAVPSKARAKVMVHFALVAEEVVPQPDGALTTPAGDPPLEAMEDGDDSSGAGHTIECQGFATLGGMSQKSDEHMLLRGPATPRSPGVNQPRLKWWRTKLPR